MDLAEIHPECLSEVEPGSEILWVRTQADWRKKKKVRKILCIDPAELQTTGFDILRRIQ